MRRAWGVLSVFALLLPLSMIWTYGYGRGGDTATYISGAEAILAGTGYDAVPFPPGYPLLIAGADIARLPVGWISVAAGLALVAGIWWCAANIGGPIAGVTAALLCALSPMLVQSGHPMMSDTPAAALVVAALASALAGRWRLGGLLLGLSAWVRIVHAVFVVAAPRRSMVVVAVAACMGIGMFNVIVYGAITGYTSDAAAFDFDYLFGGTSYEIAGEPSAHSNLYLWPGLLFGRFGALVPLLPILAAAELWHYRRARHARLAAGVIVLNVAIYAFYFFQSYRFMLVAASMVVVYASALIGRLVSRQFEQLDRRPTDTCEPVGTSATRSARGRR